MAEVVGLQLLPAMLVDSPSPCSILHQEEPWPILLLVSLTNHHQTLLLLPHSPTTSPLSCLSHPMITHLREISTCLMTLLLPHTSPQTSPRWTCPRQPPLPPPPPLPTSRTCWTCPPCQPSPWTPPWVGTLHRFGSHYLFKYTQYYLQGGADDEDIDFDDLTKRFEALKKKK